VHALGLPPDRLHGTGPYIPDGGLRELYDTTVGYQLGAKSPAVAVARRRGGLREVAAAMAAALIALELAAMHWIYFYVAWFLPPLLVAVFAATAADTRRDPRAQAAFVDSAA
jgi:hypothetical protein